MASGAPPPDEGTGQAAGESRTTPPPPGVLHLTLTSLGEGETLHRVYLDRYRPDAFDPGLAGNARFSPIRDDAGNPVPTLYAGTTMACALMETVFHDVPHTAGLKSVDKGKLDGQRHATLQVARALELADLSSVPLRKLGITRKQLIDTEKNRYPATRAWAAAIHRGHPQVQGLCWVSRQDDSARAVVLFGDRVPAGALVSNEDSRSLADDPVAYDAVLDLADRIGVNIVPGQG